MANRENIEGRNNDYRSITEKTILLPEIESFHQLEIYNSSRPVFTRNFTRGIDHFRT
jgi:hypothetical protein